VRLAIEPLHPRQFDFINTVGDALELIEEVDDPLCGVFIDTYQVWRRYLRGTSLEPATASRGTGRRTRAPASLEDRRPR